LRAKVYDLKLQCKSIDEIRRAMGNAISNRFIKMVWKETNERLDKLGKFPLGRPPAESLMKNHSHIFFNAKNYNRYLKEGGAQHQARLQRNQKERERYAKKMHNCSAEELKKIRESKQTVARECRSRQWREGLPFADQHLEPYTGECLLGDFKQPPLEPGELRTLELKNKSNNKPFHPGIAEIGIPNQKAWHDLGKNLQHLEQLAPNLAQAVGPARKHVNIDHKDDSCPGWRVKKSLKTDCSDITYLYPSTPEKLDELLKMLEEIGLGQILKNIPEFLDIPTTEGEPPALTFTEINFIIVSSKKHWFKHWHSDMTGAGTMATLLVPLVLPNCREPEIKLQAENARIRAN